MEDVLLRPVFGPALRAGLSASGLVACGAVAVFAWRGGLWGTLGGALLVAVWIAATLWQMLDRAGAIMPPVPAGETSEAPVHRLLLDAAPTPMLAIEGNRASALNRAARKMFATDERVLPVPSGLLDRDEPVLRHEGRRWRMDRVLLEGDPPRQVVALVDVEREERAAEARAAAELIQILGHELMNGLAPIASLAESGMAAVEAEPLDTALVGDILGTIARHSEGLQRFAEAYRALARLPEPRMRPVRIGELIADLQRLFATRWPSVALLVDIAEGPPWPVDRDQLVQALWALLQNAAEAAQAGTPLQPAMQPAIELSVRYEDSRLLITIRDNGAGIAPNGREQMFRPFFTTKPRGTGIGLSLARQIMHGHGGALTLEECRPATFQLCFPGAVHVFTT